MNRKIDSHVQISKLIIKQFNISKENGKTFVLDLKNKQIYKKAPSKIGISYGYFDEYAESILGKYYETPLGQLIKKIKNSCDNKNSIFELSNEGINLLAEFLTMLLVRDPNILSKVKEKSLFRKDITASELITKVEQTNLKNNLFYNHYPVLVFNETERSFISSIKGYALFKKEEGDINWWFPLNPKFGVCYAGKDLFNDVFKYSMNVTLSECKSVEFYNDYIYKQAINNNNKYVFSNDKTELTRIRDLLNSIANVLT